MNLNKSKTFGVAIFDVGGFSEYTVVEARSSHFRAFWITILVILGLGAVYVRLRRDK